ncbi:MULTISPECIES: hypothetical protein [Burkholderia]|uniref:hypothetical protein n=1 Tax=Burkholderia TaxID=32008 RepID=UPI00117DCBA0|nr:MULTISPECIES: hypothetical protein [Burkholderia]
MTNTKHLHTTIDSTLKIALDIESAMAQMPLNKYLEMILYKRKDIPEVAQLISDSSEQLTYNMEKTKNDI